VVPSTLVPPVYIVATLHLQLLDNPPYSWKKLDVY
jgi:hypothetical protein